MYINTYVGIAFLAVVALIIIGLIAGYYGMLNDDFNDRFGGDDK